MGDQSWVRNLTGVFLAQTSYLGQALTSLCVAPALPGETVHWEVQHVSISGVVALGKMAKEEMEVARGL